MVLRDVNQIETVHEIIGCGQNYRSHKHVSRTTFAPHIFAPKSPSILDLCWKAQHIYTHTPTLPPKKVMTSQNTFWTFRHETVEDALMPEVQNLRRVKPAVLATKDRAFWMMSALGTLRPSRVIVSRMRGHSQIPKSGSNGIVWSKKLIRWEIFDFEACS